MAQGITIALILMSAAVVLFSLIDDTAYFLGWKNPCTHIRKGVCRNCGHLTNSSYEPHFDSDAVIRCVVCADQQHCPLVRL
jgi:hypothetical protein